MTYLQAIVIALVQGVTELFPVSSLGHSVLVPAWLGGRWDTLVTQSAAQRTGVYLAYIVALHVATALALLWYFRADWARIIAGFFRSLTRQRIVHRDERIAWMIVIATIPVGLVGVAMEKKLRVLFAKPAAAGAFLFANGLVLLAGEWLRRTGRRIRVSASREQMLRSLPGGGQGLPEPPPPTPADIKDPRFARASDGRIARLSFADGLLVGVLQVAALLAGISRSGITMVGALWRGLDHEDAARFAFLLATPPILLAGLYKLPTLLGSAGRDIHGQVVVGMVITAVAAYLSTRFLLRWFATRTLTPFAIYCLVFGALSIARFR